LLAVDLQESSKTDDGSKTGTGESGNLAGTGGGDLGRSTSGGGSTGTSRRARLAALTTVAGLTSRVNGDYGGVVAVVGGRRSGAVVANDSGGGDDGLGDGARAVSDGEGGGLGDSVGLVAVDDLSRTGAVGSVGSDDLGGVGNVLGVGSDASSESESSSELHFVGLFGVGIKLR
jgi:hypothetical protein